LSVRVEDFEVLIRNIRNLFAVYKRLNDLLQIPFGPHHIESQLFFKKTLVL